jgi:phosphonate degradation associated HDIG domain protein
MALLTLDDVARLFRERGGRQYDGEPVTQLEHALQTAHLAEQSDADNAMVTAALLHDVGHLLTEHHGTPTLDGIDDTHEALGARSLAHLFDESVIGPIRWHVTAKRYLCRADPQYHARLSGDSQRSLVLQGGILDQAQAARFIAGPGAAAAVSVRLWDDLAKQAGLVTPTLEHFMQRATRCMISTSRA